MVRRCTQYRWVMSSSIKLYQKNNVAVAKAIGLLIRFRREWLPVCEMGLTDHRHFINFLHTSINMPYSLVYFGFNITLYLSMLIAVSRKTDAASEQIWMYTVILQSMGPRTQFSTAENNVSLGIMMAPTNKSLIAPPTTEVFLIVLGNIRWLRDIWVLGDVLGLRNSFRQHNITDKYFHHTLPLYSSLLATMIGSANTNPPC